MLRGNTTVWKDTSDLKVMVLEMSLHVTPENPDTVPKSHPHFIWGEPVLLVCGYPKEFLPVHKLSHNSKGIVLWDTEQVLLVSLEWRRSSESGCGHLYSLSSFIRPNYSDRTIFPVVEEQILFSVQCVDTSWD